MLVCPTNYFVSYQYKEKKYLNNSLNTSFRGLSAVKNFNAASFLRELRFENACKKYLFFANIGDKTEYTEKVLQNKEAIEKLKILDNLTSSQQENFIDAFCSITGFPNFKSVVKNIENEIISSISGLAKKEDFDIKFVGYDANCSVGRGLPIPGSDCDGLFMIIDTKKHKEPWYPGKIRWDFKDYVNQRILSTPANHLPEVLSTDFIDKGLQIAQKAFEQCNFSKTDLKVFEELLHDDSKDFVKSAKFNIVLAQKIPNEGLNREMYYKTAMLAEIIRDGKICMNNFDRELYKKIITSPLYRYSNIIKQRGLKKSLKSKYISRQTLENDFYKMDTNERFELIKDILYFSFNKTRKDKNEKYFSNIGIDSFDEMGNIETMYKLICS